MADEPARPDFPRRHYTKGDEPFPGKSIGYYSNDTKLFDALYKALEPDEWDEICDSRLGVFLRFNRLQFEWASRLVHYMLGFQLVCNKKYEIWSLVGSNPIRFSLNEFEAITGLNCEDVDNLDQPVVEVTEEMDEFWEKLGVSAECGPSIEQLIAACMNASDWENRNDRIRLGYLAIYAGFIEARKLSTPTRLNMARLVMDLDAFLDYPWGRVAFKNLIQSVKEKDITKSYTIDGFIEPLQIWVYEAMPDFGKEIGEPLPGNPTPPLLAYRGSRGRRNVKEAILKQTRFNNLRVIGDKMEPVWYDDDTDVRINNILSAFRGEFGRPWKWGRGLWDLEGVYVSKNKNVKEEVKAENKRPGDFAESSGKRHCPGQATAMEFSLLDSIKQEINSWGAALVEEIKDGFSACKSKFEMLNEKIEGLATELDGLKVKGDSKAASDSNEHTAKANTEKESASASKVHTTKANTEKEAAPLPPHPSMNKAGQSKSFTVQSPTQQSSPQCVLPKERPIGPTDPPAGNIKKVVDSTDLSDTDDESPPVFIRSGIPTSEELTAKAKKQEPRIEAAMLAAQGKAHRVKRLAQSQISPYEGNKTAKSIVTNPSPKPTYDPFQKPQAAKKKTLIDFLKKDRTFNLPEEKKSPQCKWWYILRTKTIWLQGSHMDAFLNLLRHRYTNHPELFRSDRISFLDAVFSQLWTSKYNDFTNSIPNADGSGRVLPGGAFQYHCGEYPPFARSNKQWALEVDDLYLPLNVKNTHWVALWISIPDRHITVWDSIPICSSDEELRVAIEPIAVMLPYVIKTLASPDLKPLYSTEKFTHGRIVEGVPPNKKPGDCGVYTLKYIECHALGVPFSTTTLCDANMTWIREKMACDLFHDIQCRGPNEENYLDEIGLYDLSPIRDPVT